MKHPKHAVLHIFGSVTKRQCLRKSNFNVTRTRQNFFSIERQRGNKPLFVDDLTSRVFTPRKEAEMNVADLLYILISKQRQYRREDSFHVLRTNKSWNFNKNTGSPPSVGRTGQSRVLET